MVPTTGCGSNGAGQMISRQPWPPRRVLHRHSSVYWRCCTCRPGAYRPPPIPFMASQCDGDGHGNGGHGRCRLCAPPPPPHPLPPLPQTRLPPSWPVCLRLPNKFLARTRRPHAPIALENRCQDALSYARPRPSPALHHHGSSPSPKLRLHTRLSLKVITVPLDAVVFIPCRTTTPSSPNPSFRDTAIS